MQPAAGAGWCGRRGPAPAPDGPLSVSAGKRRAGVRQAMADLLRIHGAAAYDTPAASVR